MPTRSYGAHGCGCTQTRRRKRSSRRRAHSTCRIVRLYMCCLRLRWALANLAMLLVAKAFVIPVSSLQPEGHACAIATRAMFCFLPCRLGRMINCHIRCGLRFQGGARMFIRTRASVLLWFFFVPVRRDDRVFFMLPLLNLGRAFVEACNFQSEAAPLCLPTPYCFALIAAALASTAMLRIAPPWGPEASDYLVQHLSARVGGEPQVGPHSKARGSSFMVWRCIALYCSSDCVSLRHPCWASLGAAVCATGFQQVASYLQHFDSSRLGVCRSPLHQHRGLSPALVIFTSLSCRSCTHATSRHCHRQSSSACLVCVDPMVRCLPTAGGEALRRRQGASIE